jgi:hypothetical protein
MSDGERDDETPQRFRRLRFNPLRDVLPWVVVVVGLIEVVRGLIGIGHGGGPAMLLIGLGMVVIGVVVFIINRAQTRRGR